MRINGHVLDGPCEEVTMLTRLGGDIPIIARAVTDMTEFEELVPKPKPPAVLKKGGFVADEDSKEYKDMLQKYGEMRFAYKCIKSLEPSNIEWEEVRLDKPSTWLKWTDELKEAGLSDVECNRILVCIMNANALNEAKLEKARADFLRGREANQELSSGRQTEQPSLPSGEPASVSE